MCMCRCNTPVHTRTHAAIYDSNMLFFEDAREKSRRCSSQLDHRSAPEKSKAKQVRQALAPACCWRHAWLDVLRWHCLSRLDAMWPLKERKILRGGVDGCLLSPRLGSSKCSAMATARQQQLLRCRHGSAAAAALAAPIDGAGCKGGWRRGCGWRAGASVPAGASEGGGRILPHNLPTVRFIEVTPRLQPREVNLPALFVSAGPRICRQAGLFEKTGGLEIIVTGFVIERHVEMRWLVAGPPRAVPRSVLVRDTALGCQRLREGASVAGALPEGDLGSRILLAEIDVDVRAHHVLPPAPSGRATKFLKRRQARWRHPGAGASWGRRRRSIHGYKRRRLLNEDASLEHI